MAKDQYSNRRLISLSLSHSSLLIVYEGCDESSEYFSSPDFHFLSPVGGGRRSNSDCELERISDTDYQHRKHVGAQTCYKPARSSSDAQIPRLKQVAVPQRHQPRNQLDFDSLSITDTSSDCYLTDSCDAQSFSTSPQSVDSGLECYMMDQNSSSSSSTNEYCSWTSISGYQTGLRLKKLLRNSGTQSATGYECDNSTDSTDSGVFSSVANQLGSIKKTAMMKRTAAMYMDSEEDSESDMEHHQHGQQKLCRPLELEQNAQKYGMAMSPSACEEEGELTPVLEVSRSEEFTEEADGNQSQKKRRVMDEDREEKVINAASKPDNCWADCVDVRMIDFAHTTFSGYLGLDERVHWGPDNGYLFGLETLTGILSELRGDQITLPPQRC